MRSVYIIFSIPKLFDKRQDSEAASSFVFCVQGITLLFAAAERNWKAGFRHQHGAMASSWPYLAEDGDTSFFTSPDVSTVFSTEGFW